PRRPGAHASASTIPASPARLPPRPRPRRRRPRRGSPAGGSSSAAAAPDLRALLAERGVGEGLQRLAQRSELVDERRDVVARVQPPVQPAQLVRERVEPLEQRVELPVADFFLLHRGSMVGSPHIPASGKGTRCKSGTVPPL